MTLKELRLLEKIIDNSGIVTLGEIREAQFIIKRDIKLKVNDPRIFSKDRKKEDAAR